MIVIDANVLISAIDRDAPRHAAAVSWMQGQAAAGEILGIPWVCLLALVRICTLPSILARPLGIDKALDAVERLLGNAEVLHHHPGRQGPRGRRRLAVGHRERIGNRGRRHLGLWRRR